MTRINTNVSSLVARNTLNRSNAALEQSLTRLSTGLRINTGKDDPAGLIASENLRSDITSIKKAISNTDRANQVIATADSALGQVSSLLNDIRGLVVESANEGALSDDQIAANQLQIDSSLEALNRIAQTTTFQGRKLLDGSLDFITSAGTNFAQLSDLQIDQANLGTTGSVNVDVTVTTAATQAQVDIDNIPAATAGANATANLTVSNAVAQATGTVAITTGAASGFDVTAKPGGAAAGAEGNGALSIVVNDNATESVTYDANTNTLTVEIDIAGGNNTTADLAALINSDADFATSNVTGGTEVIDTNDTGSATLAGGRDAGSATIAITADTAGATPNGVTATLIEDNTITNNTAVAAFNGVNIEVRVRGTVTKAAIATAINGLDGYSATVTASSGDSNYTDSLDTPPAAAVLGSGVAASGGLVQDVVFQLSGSLGSEVFSFGAGTAIADLAAAINSQSDATGVEATVNGTTLELTSSEYGSAESVNIEVMEEGVGGTITAGLGGSTSGRGDGADVVASVNGILANGKGNRLSVNTATLDLSTTVAAGFTGTASFDITGGGALFQLGPDVVSNQQARVGIRSVNTGRLGGINGKLYQLGSGGDADLSADSTLASNIIGEAIDQVTSLRGRLGAFQRTTLETNKNALNDTLVNLSDAESSIRDADFAVESANLTRAQILVQSGTTVLQISNQNPQNVLALLR